MKLETVAKKIREDHHMSGRRQSWTDHRAIYAMLSGEVVEMTPDIDESHRMIHRYVASLDDLNSDDWEIREYRPNTFKDDLEYLEACIRDIDQVKNDIQTSTHSARVLDNVEVLLAVIAKKYER